MEKPVTAPERSGIIRDPRSERERGFPLCGAPSDAEIDEVKSAVLAKLALAVGKDPSTAVDRDWFVATALVIRDRIMHRWLASDRESQSKGRKRVYYLSLEFLIGRLLGDVLCNLGLTELFHTALGDLGVDLNVLRTAEHGEPGHTGLWLWYPLSARVVPASHSGRGPAGISRRMARLRKSLGIRAARHHLRYRLRRPRRIHDMAARRAALHLAPRRNCRSRCL